MPTAMWTVEVNRSPQEVFDYLADVTKHAEWSPKPYRIEGLSGPVGMGTTFTSFGWIPRDKDHRNDVEVTEWNPPSALTLTSTEKGEKIVNRFVLTPTGSGTRVERTMDMPKPPGVVGAIFPLFLGAFIKPAVQKGMNMFKQHAEAAGTTTS
jgi:uncharacterized protein YndB with AHSA1/START domain